MAATLYVAVFASAHTPTWARADVGNGRHGFSATGWQTSTSTTSGVPTSGTGNDVAGGVTLSGLTAGTAYKLWLIWDDGTNTSNSGAPLGSAEFTTLATVTGTSSITISLTGTASASVIVGCTSSGTLALTGTAAGSVIVSGTSSATINLTGTASATVTDGVVGSSSATITLTGTAAGTSTVVGTSSGSIVLTGTASATVGDAPITATSSATITLTGSAAGTSTVGGISSLSIFLTGSALADTGAPVAAPSTIGPISYAPTEPPEDPQQLRRWLKDEFQLVSNAVTLLAAGHFDVTYVAPAKPRRGDVRYADGSSWDPGSGTGIYYYSGSAWVNLG